MINKYRMELDAEKHPVLVKEEEYHYDTEQIDSPKKVVKLVNRVFRLKHLAEEHVVMIAFDSKSHPVGVFSVSQGNVNTAMCSPRETYIRALSVGAEHIIVCHNHPSGDPRPSDVDVKIARKLREAGKLLDIRLEDFLIVGGEQYYSAIEEGLLA